MKRTQLLFATIVFSIACVALPGAPLKAADAAGEFSSTTIDLGCVVADVAKSVKFYTEAIGFKEVAGFKVPGTLAVDAGLSTSPGELDIHVLTLGEGPSATKLKLMQFPAGKSKKGDTATIESQLGFRYLTLHVTDTAAALARLEKAGVKPLGKGASELPESLAKGVYLTVVRDPDGNMVELVGPKKK